MNKRDWSLIETQVRKRMEARGLDELMVREFLRRVRLVYDGASGKVDWDSIGDLKSTDSVRLEDLAGDASSSDWGKLVVVKLNGGLGTTMGLSTAKSLIPVKDGYNFLQIIRRQIEALRKSMGVSVPMFLMNSFSTRDDCLADDGIRDINAKVGDGLPADFLQNMVPRIDQETLLPIGDGQDDAHWCPPGHGDIFLSLKITGLLDELLSQGYRVAFLSNGDNLSARADERILSYFLKEKLDFASEVTPKTLADLKGGVLYRPLNSDHSGIELLETAQVPEKHLQDFQDIQRFQYFNINNLWVNLESLRDTLAKGTLDLSLIVNPKEIDGQKILQLETAMGAAVGHFDRARVVIVPRDRFAPVKSCGDLLVRRSDAYVLRDDFALFMNPERTFGEPTIALDDRYYKKLDSFESHFAVVPSLKDAEELTVSGPVLFDVPITIQGKVMITNGSTVAKSIAALGRSVLKNEQVEL